MKAPYRASILAAALVVLGGCASTQAAVDNSNLTEDQAYVATVDKLAHDRGIAVRWVNPPQKRPATPNKDL